MQPEATHIDASLECTFCNARVKHADRDGIGYCDQHWRKVHPERCRRISRWAAAGLARPIEQRTRRLVLRSTTLMRS
jgi:hypothetical protein